MTHVPDVRPGSRRPGRARPPLSKRLRPRHWMAIDVAAAVVAGLCGIATAGLGPGDVYPGAHSGLPVLIVAGLIAVPVALRRRWPLTMFWSAIGLAGLAMLGRNPNAAMTALIVCAYVLYMVAVTRRRRTAVAALVCALVAVAGAQAADSLGAMGNGTAGVPVALVMFVAWFAGHSARQRQAYAVMLQDQAAGSAVAEERLRIARELHDVVAHSMSVIAVQAGYGQYVIDSGPADAKGALGAIQATSRDALDEMRRMLGALRQRDGGDRAPVPLTPEAGLGELGRLVERTAGAGIRVTLRQTGSARELPVGIDLAAYRVLQEALTNVIKHAGGGARCDVVLAYGDDALMIEVTDDGGRSGGTDPEAVPRAVSGTGSESVSGTASSTGHGVIGMRERVALCGGGFSAGPAHGTVLAGAGTSRGFRVSARFPLPKVPPAAPLPPADVPLSGA